MFDCVAAVLSDPSKSGIPYLLNCNCGVAHRIVKIASWVNVGEEGSLFM